MPLTVPSKLIFRGRTIRLMILISLMLLALPVGNNVASTPNPEQRAILVVMGYGDDRAALANASKSSNTRSGWVPFPSKKSFPAIAIYAA